MTQFCDALDGNRVQRRRLHPGRAVLRITLHSESDFQNHRFPGTQRQHQVVQDPHGNPANPENFGRAIHFIEHIDNDAQPRQGTDDMSQPISAAAADEVMGDYRQVQ